MRSWERRVTGDGIPLAVPLPGPGPQDAVEATRQIKVQAHLDEEELDEIARAVRVMADVVPASEVRRYLDGAIQTWRRVRDGDLPWVGEEIELPEVRIAMARCYVDAFQSARTSLLGDLLPETS